MTNLIVSAVGFALVVIFGGLIKVWAGFKFFALSFCALLAFYWFVIFVKNYHNSYRRVDESRFNLYVAQLVNKTTLTLEQVNENRAYYVKKFKKSLWKEKLVEIGKIVFSLGVVVACISTIVTMAI